MAFKRHAPKHRRQRESIRREWCPFCDGMRVVGEMRPNFGAHVEGFSLPFSVDVMASGFMSGKLIVTYTVPDRDYRVYEKPPFPDWLDDFSYDARRTAIPDIKTKLVERKMQRFAFPINYCPMCGRDFKNNRQKLWSKQGKEQR